MERRNENPVLSRIESRVSEDSENSYAASYIGVSVKTIVLLLLAIVSGGLAIAVLPVDTLLGVLIISPIVCLVVAIVGSRSLNASMPCSIIYSIFEGITLGVITAIFDSMYQGIAIAAVAATVGTFGIMLLLYTTGIIRGGNRYRSIIISALLGILLFNVVILLSSIWTNDLVNLFYGNGIIALLLGIFIVIIAAASLILDFEAVTSIVEGGCDKRYEWMASLGLMVSIVYLYLQILRLLAIIASRSDN